MEEHADARGEVGVWQHEVREDESGQKYVSLDFAERITQTKIKVEFPAYMLSGIHIPPGVTHEPMPYRVMVTFTGD